MGDTRSEEMFRQIENWLHECGARHTKCRGASDNLSLGFVPTQLIDLQPIAASSDASLRLILTADLGSKRVDYITLSYARGSNDFQNPNQLVRATTQENWDEHLSSGIPLSGLPLTIREGIEIAQRLRIRYIWDPSLCIIQDSPADWQLESPLIPQIFAHSYVTIAASASTDINGGFFRNSERHTKQDNALFSVSSSASNGGKPTVQILAMKKQLSWGSSFNASALNQRAWAMQEREFSPRIVHFAETQVLWECRSLRASEGWPNRNVSDDDFPPFPLRPLDGLQGIYAPAKRNDLCLQTVANYSARSFKNAEDKFLALAGLAQAFAGQIIPRDKYIAGFWRQDLPRSLPRGCITVGTSARVKNTRHKGYVVSTWSWASVNGPVDISYVREIHHSVFSRSIRYIRAPAVVKLMPKIVGVYLPRVTSADDPFGQLKEGAKLPLRGCLVRAVLGNDAYYDDFGKNILISMAPDPPRHERDVSSSKLEAVGTLHFDVPSERAALNPCEEVLVLYVHPWKSPSAEYRFRDGGKGICAVGIALVRTGVREGEYRRVGHVRPLNVQCFEGAIEQEIVII